MCSMKDDFIIAKMHYTCSQCFKALNDHNMTLYRCISDACKKHRNGVSFVLCESCYEKEAKKPNLERHPYKQEECHDMRKENTDIAKETIDKDEDMECKIFETRTDFLSLCQ